MKNYLSEKDVIDYLHSININDEDFLCKDCGHLASWKDSKFYFITRSRRSYNQDKEYKFKNLSCTGHSFMSDRVYNGNHYHLSYCYECACKHFPEIPEKHFPLQPSSLRSKFLYCISDEDHSSVTDKICKRTEEKYIEKFGEEEGLKRWNAYREKEALSNKFEYKKEKHGWTEDQFNEFNKSRACTLDNFIKRYGDDEGLEKWNNYCNRQRYTNSLKYFIEKYGEEEGKEKFNNFTIKRLSFVKGSEISNEFFKKLYNNFSSNEIYTNSINNEYKLSKYSLDYYDKTLNIVVEFYGDFWHCNPIYYDEYDLVSIENRDFYAKDKWEYDQKRCKFIEEQLNTKVFVVWEHDYKNNKKQIVKNIVNQINEYVKLRDKTSI